MKRTISALAAAASCVALLALPTPAEAGPAHPVTARLETFCDAGQTRVQVVVFNPARKGHEKPFALDWSKQPHESGQTGWTSYLEARETYLFEVTLEPGSSIHIKAAADTDTEFATHLLINKTIRDHCK